MTGLPDQYASRITLDVREAATALGVGVDYIEELIAEERLTVYRHRGRGKRLITVHSLLREVGVPTATPDDTTEGTEG